jgi:hypothetical protein
VIKKSFPQQCARRKFVKLNLEKNYHRPGIPPLEDEVLPVVE